MSISVKVDSNKVHFKKLDTKLNSGNINIFLKKNNSNHLIFEGNIKEKILDKSNFRKARISPFKNLFNKSLSSALLKNDNYSMKMPKKFYIKSPMTIFQKNNSQKIIKESSIMKNIPLLPININKQHNNNSSIEYNTINYIINNFNLSYKNFEPIGNKKTDNMNKFHNYFDCFNKNNLKIKNLNIIKKNNSSSNIKNTSNLSEYNNNNSNRNNNNINDESKIEEILLENKQKQIKIKKRILENKNKLMMLKELEKRNQKLTIEYQEIKNKNMEYSKSLERIFRFLKVLKNSGLDISEMMENISPGEDYDEFNEENEETDEKKKNESKMTDCSISLSSLNNLSSGQIKEHEEFSGSKLNLKGKNGIPLLNFNNLKKH
jgi:hypothetical protein